MNQTCDKFPLSSMEIKLSALDYYLKNENLIKHMRGEEPIG